MDINQLLESVSEVRENTDYWMVRTDGGYYFDAYLENDFVAIGWNEITVADLKNPKRIDHIRKVLASTEKLNPDTPSGKGQITTIVNKLYNFVELKRGDIIIIPSTSSYELAFGMIDDQEVYVENDQLCNFRKRRKVRWLEKRMKSTLDPIYFKMKMSRHALTNVTDYSEHIDSVINTVFIKDSHAHFVLDFKKHGDINVDVLLNLMGNLRKLTNEINTFYGFNEPVNDQSIRLNLQSPGHIEFKLFSGKSLITLAFILSAYCCRPGTAATLPDDLPEEVITFIEENSGPLSEVDSAMNELDANFEKLKDLSYGSK